MAHPTPGGFILIGLRLVFGEIPNPLTAQQQKDSLGGKDIATFYGFLS